MCTNCPNCGAPVDNTRSKCEYCGTPYFLSTGTIKEVDVLYANDKPIEYVGYLEAVPMTPNEVREAVGLEKLSEACSAMGVSCAEAEKALFNFTNAFKKL